MKYYISSFILLICTFSISVAQQETPEDRLAKLGIELPPSPPPVANYVNAVTTGNLVFLAGKGPNKAVGMASQPRNIAVEIEMIVKISNDLNHVLK